MNQDTGWFNSYDKCGPDQRNHPLARYTNTPQPNQPPRLWDQVPGLPSPVCIGHNIQSLHPYGGGFIPNQFHPAYTPRPMGSYQTYTPHNPGYNYQNNQTPRMRNNNSRWQRRNRQDRPRGFSNYSPGGFQHSTPGPSKQEPKTQEIETEEQSSETSVKVLDMRPPETTTSIHIIEDDDDNVETDKKPKIKEEDKKLLMEYIDLSDEKDSPEEALNKFEFESRTKVLDKLCGTIDEAKFIEGLKQFKIILKDQICGIRLKSRLITMLMKYILFLGMNYKSLASGFVEEYLDLMEDVIAMFCQVVTDFINMQIADNKRTFIERLGFQIKQLISCSLLFRMDSIMHCLFKVHLSPVFLEGHSAMWTDVFLYFLRNSKFDPKHDDLLRIFVAWKRLLSIRTSKDAKMINGYMFESLRKPLEELKSLPYLKEFMETYHDNPRCNTQEMLNKYWKWWKEERPKQLWAGLEEPTYIQLPGTFNLEYQPANVFLMNQSSTESQDDEISKLFEDRRTGKSPGLTQLGRKMPYGRQNNLFWPNSLGNIFDDSPCMASDFDYYDDNDLIIAEPRVVETVVVDDDDDDDVIFIGDGKESNAQQVDVAEQTTEVIEESNIDDLNCEEFVNEELLFNAETSLEVEVQPDKETSPKEIDESKNETAIKEICDSFVSSYPEDSDSNDDIVDFPIEDNLPSTSTINDDIFDKWEKTFDNQAPDNSDFFDSRETSTIEETTLKFTEQPVNEVEPPKSPEESNDKDCDESSKTETESSQTIEIVPEKATNDFEKLPDEQEKLSETKAETSTAKTKCNGSLGICMQDLREVLNEMEKHYKRSDEEKNACLKEVPLILEEPLLKHINLSTEEEEDNLDNYAAIVQVACSDDDINEFASGYADGVYDSGEISSPAFEPLESNQIHYNSEKQQQEIIDSSVISETLATEPVISPEETSLCQSDFGQTVDKDEELLNGPPTEVEVPESTSTAAINLASPCHDNSDLITIRCGLVLKQEPNVEEVQPNFVPNNYELEKYSGYHLEAPQRQDSFPEPPPQSGSQPYSPPSIRIGNAVSALDENSTMLYTPILQDSQKIQPAIVPDVLPQQDLPKQNAVPPAPESSPNSKLVDKLKIVILQSAPAIERPSSSSNSTTEASETPDKPKKRSRRGCQTKDSLKSKKKEKLAKPLSPQDNGLFEYAIEGPTGKPLWNTAPNMLWDDSEDPYESPKSPLLVKSDKQLVSILKKPNAKKIKEIEKVKAYNQPRLIIRITSKDRISYDMRAKEIIKDLTKQNIKNAADERVCEMARLMILKGQQDRKDFNGILKCNFNDVEDYKRIFSKPRESRQVRFGGVTAHRYPSYPNGERTPEKRNRDFHVPDERPDKKARLKIRTDLMEDNVRQFPMKITTPHKNPTGSLATKLNGKISKEPGKSLNFSNFIEEIPAQLKIPNGIALKSPAKIPASTSNNQLEDALISEVIETPLKAPAIKNPVKSLSFFMEESDTIQSPKRPSKSLTFSDLIESAATEKLNLDKAEIQSKKSCKRLSWSNIEESEVGIAATEKSEGLIGLPGMEESKVASNGFSLPVRRKAGRPPGAKNKGLSFSNTKKRRPKRPAKSEEENLASMKDSEAEASELNGIGKLISNKEPMAEPKTSRTRNPSQKRTQLAQLRDKTTGNDSCDITESKPGRRRKADHF